MRNYPTVPNVFRVASSHNIDTDCGTAAGGNNIKTTSGTNTNSSTGLLNQEQQKQKQPNGIISGQQQSLLKSSISSQTNKTTATLSQTTTITTVTTSPLSILSSTILKTNISQQQDSIKNNVDFIAHNHNSLQRQQQQQHHHKLTTHASIEQQPQCLSTSQEFLHNSPYTTLPRNAAPSLSLMSPTTSTFNVNGNIHNEQQQQQYIHNFTKNRSNNDNNHKNCTKDSKMLGVINTISGSIPATGYTMDHLTTSRAKGNSDKNSVDHPTISMDSDLNVGVNNSNANPNKSNGVHEQQQKHFRLQQQQQRRDFKHIPTTTIHDFTTYRRQYPCSSLERNTNGYLWIITPVAASISVAIVIAALAGPHWLFTEEKLPNTLYNGTANFNVLDDGAFITRYTKSSLWIICTTLQGVETYSCIKIDYFSEKGYQPDPHDSASAIPYTVTKSCPFFLASGVVLLLSFIVFLIPTCSHQNNLYYFSAGIMFIVSGLLMLIGLIAYISILKAEIGSKLRPRSTLQPPLFKVTYGQSFFLFVFGFITTEFVGLLNVFLYISLQEVGYYSRLSCFTISNLQEKIKEGENHVNSHTYKSYDNEIESKKPIDRIKNQRNKIHQVIAEDLELNTQKILKNMGHGSGKSEGGQSIGRKKKVFDTATDVSVAPYACRKHPNGMSSTMFLNELDRRYYFEKPSAQNKCNLHSKNLAKSLNELYTEATTTSALLPPPPPPLTLRAGLQMQTQTLPRPPQQFSDSPQEFPLTRSVSTTTDIYATRNFRFIDGGATTTAATKSGINANYQKRNVATNTGNKTDIETQTNGCIGGDSNTKTQSLQGNNITNSKKTMQQQNRRNNNIYNTNYATTYGHNNKNNNNNDHQQRCIQPPICANNNINDDDDNNNNNNNNNNKINDNGSDDNDIDVDEDQPQKLCGLRRSIRKTKDELFQEFCKRAGVRPKPKNIYYIANHNDDDDDGNEVDSHATIFTEDNSTHQSNNIENEIQRKPLRLNNNSHSSMGNNHLRRNEIPGNHQRQQNQQHCNEYHDNVFGMENNRIFCDDAIDVVDIDEDMNENGLKKLTESEDHLYAIDDNIHLMPQSIHNGRRASMYVEPNYLRRLNSNLSLHALYAPTDARAGLRKSLYDLDTTDSEFGSVTTQHQQPHYALRDTYGGSQQRLHHDYHQQAIYQSRTLPRAFLKRSADSQDTMTAVGLNANTNIYNTSQQRLTTLIMQQQQLQQENRYLFMPSERELHNSRYSLHKSNDELNRQYMQQQQQQQPVYIRSNQLQQYQQHNSISSANYNTTSTLTQPPLVQWPAAIPSSPSNFSGSFRMFGSANNNNVIQNTTTSHPLLVSSNSNSGGGNNTLIAATGGQQVAMNGSSTASQVPSKFQRAYAFDEQRRSSAVLADAFDLDEIERERRRSHANLFTSLSINPTTANTNNSGTGDSNKNQDHFDMINGTAV